MTYNTLELTITQDHSFNQKVPEIVVCDLYKVRIVKLNKIALLKRLRKTDVSRTISSLFQIFSVRKYGYWKGHGFSATIFSPSTNIT